MVKPGLMFLLFNVPSYEAAAMREAARFEQLSLFCSKVPWLHSSWQGGFEAKIVVHRESLYEFAKLYVEFRAFSGRMSSSLQSF